MVEENTYLIIKLLEARLKEQREKFYRLSPAVQAVQAKQYAAYERLHHVQDEL